MFSFSKKIEMPTAEQAMPGRMESFQVNNCHFVNGHPIKPPFPENMCSAMFGLGCFWGAEKIFWQYNGVYTTAVGYAGGYTPNPSYEEVCSGKTGHNEAVLVVYDADQITYHDLLIVFWEAHDPTQGMRQGNDAGTQYRSGIYFYNDEQRQQAEKSRDQFEVKLKSAGYGQITTEIVTAPEFYYAEDYHQQYLAKSPNGYCGLGGTGISCG